MRNCKTLTINYLSLLISAVAASLFALDRCLQTCANIRVSAFSSRASSECRPAGADLVEGRVQRQERQDSAAQVGRAAGHSLWNLFDRGLCERQPHWEDAHPAAGGGKGES